MDLPLEAEKNTAGQALLALAEARELQFGFDMWIEKGIPLASGLGGSAASAVAAVVAANAMLDEPLTRIELLKVAMEGEAVASGSRHADNISPSLFGGLVLTVGIDEPRVKQIPVPEEIHAVIVHPHLQVSTKQARAILSRHGADVGLRLADGEPGRLHLRLLHQRPGPHQGLARGRDHREAAPGADPGFRRSACRGARSRARWAARSPAPGPTVFALCLERDAAGGAQGDGAGLRRDRASRPTSGSCRCSPAARTW